MRENTLERPAEPQVRYSDLFWLFLAGSVLGVIIEGVFCVVTKGRWESHVVSVWGWFNVLYGLGAAGLYAGSVKLRHRPLLARAAILMGVATALELACGMLLKWGLGMRAWDYSHNFLNFSGIICLRFSLYWGLVALVVCLTASRITGVLERLRTRTLQAVCLGMSVILAGDFFLTAVAITRWSARHYGYGPGNPFTRMVDQVADDQWMESRFVEWRFLSEADN